MNEVVPQAELLTAARRWVDQILECAPLSVRVSKQCTMDGMESGSIEAAMNQKYDQLMKMFKSKDFIEGPLAFSQKRKPEWSGE